MKDITRKNLGKDSRIRISKRGDNKGSDNTGSYNTGDGNTGDFDTGNFNTGDFNAGNNNAGCSNKGNWNSGSGNVGSQNSGDNNSGSDNIGSNNVGSKNVGDFNVGFYNSGVQNSGDSNVGNCNSGSCNVGDRNAGYGNRGNGNTGFWNLGDGNTGYFNTKTPSTVRIFNKEAVVGKDGIDFPSWFFFSLTEWVSCTGTSGGEKEGSPKYVKMGGYLRVYDYKEAWRRSWKRASEEDRKKTLNLPNWDNEIFKKITGIDVEGELKRLERKVYSREEIASSLGISVEDLLIEGEEEL